MNSDRNLVPHQGNQEYSSAEVNGGVIISRLKRCSHNEAIFTIVGRYLVSMVDTCRPRALSTWDINIRVSPKLYSNYHPTEKRPYQYNKLLEEKSLSLFYALLYRAFVHMSLSTIRYPGVTHLTCP